MKKILIFILLVLCVVPLFAVTSFYKQLPAMFLVDLNSGIYYNHESSTSAPRWKSGSATTSTSTSIYYDNQIIAVFGVTGATEDVNFTISFNNAVANASWLYLLDTGDTTISRPFGLDLICKGRNSNNTGENYADFKENSKSLGPVIHVGLQDTSTLTNEGKVLDSSTTTITFPTITATELATYGGIVWFDVCLVLPKLNDDGTVELNGTTYTVRSSDEVYSAKLTVTVTSGSYSDHYDLDMTGTYKSSSSSSTDTGLKSMMNVIPTAAAKSIGIKGSGEEKIKVADYSYLTESKYIGDSSAKNYYTKNAYIFLSSSSAQGTNGGKFKLRRENESGGYDADSAGNSVTFTAYISSDGSNYTSFDGTTTYSSSNTGSYFTATRKQEASQNTQEYVRWYSEGSIYIEITPDTGESIGSLLGGKYTETIYIHVVSPE